jgi:hypothetical protein
VWLFIPYYYLLILFDLLEDTLPFHNLDDAEFRHMIFELQNGPVNFDEDTLIYNPFSSSIVAKKNLANFGQIDPDSNFYQDVNNCDYYTEHKFNEKLHIEETSDDLSFLHINIEFVKEL